MEKSYKYNPFRQKETADVVTIVIEVPSLSDRCDKINLTCFDFDIRNTDFGPEPSYMAFPFNFTKQHVVYPCFSYNAFSLNHILLQIFY